MQYKSDKVLIMDDRLAISDAALKDASMYKEAKAVLKSDLRGVMSEKPHAKYMRLKAENPGLTNLEL